MANLLLTGPPAAGKSAEALRLIEAATTPTVMVDFQQQYASALGLRRDPSTGRYPRRREQDAYALAYAEYMRQAAITGALSMELDIIVTSADGDIDRRAFLLGRLGPGASEIVLDPGIEVVTQRLTIAGYLDPQCVAALARFYNRLPQ